MHSGGAVAWRDILGPADGRERKAPARVRWVAAAQQVAIDLQSSIRDLRAPPESRAERAGCGEGGSDHGRQCRVEGGKKARREAMVWMLGRLGR
jgi:hypothetical protein